jgi:hypothetical protein
LQVGFSHDSNGFAGQGFEFPWGQVFFSELDVVDAGFSGFGDFLQQEPAASGFVPGALASVGDVVEQPVREHNSASGHSRMRF